jgi:hypothetical protein
MLVSTNRIEENERVDLETELALFFQLVSGNWTV